MKQIRVFFLFILSFAFIMSGMMSLAAQYQYDDLHRLKRIKYDDGTVVQYEYDFMGNRLAKTVVVNQPPDISNISDQIIDYNTPVTINFTVEDPENDPISLTGISSNQGLISDENITFMGNGANRTLTLTPQTNQTGLAQITINAEDDKGLLSQTSFHFTVENRSILNVVPKTKNLGSTGGILSITITNSGSGSLYWSAKSQSNWLTIINSDSGQDDGIIHLQYERNTTIERNTQVDIWQTHFPDLKEIIEITQEANATPFISFIENIVIEENSTINPIQLTLSDADTLIDQLTISTSSSNTRIVLDNDITISGSGMNRTLSIDTQPDVYGIADISITVGDGFSYSTNTFQVKIKPSWKHMVSGRVTDTGQNGCYNHYKSISCPQEGEIFYGQDASYLINEQSFTKLDANGNELPDTATEWIMVRDNVTGLFWEVKTDDGSMHDKDNKYTWYNPNDETNDGYPGKPGDGTDSSDYLKMLNDGKFGGFSDWRLPTIKELISLMNYNYFDSSINTNFFPYPLYSKYILSSDNYQNTVFCGIFYTINVKQNGKVKDLEYYIRAVRGKTLNDSIRFINNDNDTITDIKTGLMWSKNIIDFSMTWEDALNFCENSNFAGFNDWRLPNISELSSIMNVNESSKIYSQFFGISSEEWSSSTLHSTSNLNFAFTLEFANEGAIGASHKYTGPGKHEVRLVRGGQNLLANQTINILIPTQGSSWLIGDLMRIYWDTQSLPGKIKIQISRNGGKEGTYETIADSVENNGFYEWYVTGPISPNCMLKMESTNDPSLISTQGLFTINSNAFLAVDQTNHVLFANSGTLSLTVMNSGQGTLNWSAISNASWFTIVAGESGMNTGTISLKYQYSPSTYNIGEVIINSDDTLNGPLTVTLRSIIEVPELYTSIQEAINSSSNGDVILVKPGSYQERINFKGKAITVGSLFLISGDEKYIKQTIIDGNNSGTVVTFDSKEKRSSILTGFTIKNGSGKQGGMLCQNYSCPLIHHVVIKDNIAEEGAGTAVKTMASPLFEDVTITHNTATLYGGGILCFNAFPHFKNVNISYNYAEKDGGGVYINNESIVYIKNSSIYMNQASNGGAIRVISDSQVNIVNSTVVKNIAMKGGGILCNYINPSLVVIDNSIFRLNTPNQICLLSFLGVSSSISISFSNIQGGKSSIVDCTISTDNIAWNKGNIDIDPLFVNTDNNNFHLKSISPCIDTGNPSSDFSNEPSPNGNRVNMGRYGNTSGATLSDTPILSITPDFLTAPSQSSSLSFNIWNIGTGEMQWSVSTPDSWIKIGADNNWIQDDNITITCVSNPGDKRVGTIIISSENSYNSQQQINVYQSNGLESNDINVPFDYSSIQSAINAAIDGDTIIVEPGTYVENIDYLGKNIKVISSYGPELTIIDGNKMGSVVVFTNNETKTAVLSGFTIQNGNGSGTESYENSYGGGIYCNDADPILENLIVVNNEAPGSWLGYGGGIYLRYSDSIIKNSVLYNNYSQNGGGIACNGGAPILTNVLIHDNSSNSNGGGFYCRSSAKVIFENVTITNNSVKFLPGGAIALESNASLSIKNSILWNEGIEEIYFSSINNPNSATLEYTDIQEGKDGIITNNNGTVTWLEGNIDVDPLFVDSINNDYHLKQDSTCIDAGNPWSDYSNELIPNGLLINLGRYGNTEEATFSPRTEVPIIDLSTNKFEISSDSNYVSFTINNIGTGIMNWTVESENSWITIVQGGAGTNSGSVLVQYDHNTGNVRTGYIYINATEARKICEKITLTQLSKYYTGRIPETGDTNCTNYLPTGGDVGGDSTDCHDPENSFYGQDATYNINPRSYSKLDINGEAYGTTANRYAMVKDNITGLIWEIKTNDDSIHDKDKKYSWYEAQDFTNELNQLNFGGYSDWRLPSAKELNSIMNIDGNSFPTVNLTYFPNTQENQYWSSTANPNNTSNAYYLSFNLATYFSSTSKSNKYYVRAVRGGKNWSSNIFYRNNDDTVTNARSGLMWQQLQTNTYNWEQALVHTKNSDFAGYTDWRLPNRSELLSIIDYSGANINESSFIFQNANNDIIWTSSNGVHTNLTYAYAFSLNNNSFMFGKKGNSYKIIPVRGGQHITSGNLIITSPHQGSTWEVGCVMPLTWNTQNIEGNVRISLSKNGGKSGSFVVINDSTENDGRFDMPLTGPESVNCVLKIESLTDTSKMTTQGLFSIVDANPPTISDVPNQTIDEDASSTAIPFTISDNETTPDQLLVTVLSSNDALFPLSHLELIGTGANRILEITPFANASGEASLTITVSDGRNDSHTSFEVTVNEINDSPVIAAISDQTIFEDTAITNMALSITDLETATMALDITIDSFNLDLIPMDSNHISMTNNQRLSIKPAQNQWGEALIRVSVSDGEFLTQTQFKVTVLPVIDNAPQVINTTTDFNTQSSSGLTITPNALDGSEVSYFKITDITNGTLYRPDGQTAISNNEFISRSDAFAGLKWTPAFHSAATGQFNIQASLNNTDDGLGGEMTTAYIFVNKGTQTIDFESLTEKTYGDPVFPLNATSSSNLPVGYSSTNLSVAIIQNNNVTIVGAGITDILAYQNGDINYQPAQTQSQQLLIHKKQAGIEFQNLKQTYDSTPIKATAITDPAGLSVIITYTLSAPVHAGTYDVKAEIHHQNYTGMQMGQLIIEKAALTAKADNKTKQYGNPVPELTLSYIGLASGDSAPDICPMIQSDVLAYSPVGEYAIVLSGGSDANYTLTLIDGVMAVMSIVPEISTSVSDIKTYTAIGYVSLDDNGGEAIQEMGLCWNTTGNPDLSDSCKHIPVENQHTNHYSGLLTDLAAGTKYYLSAYATNTAGTAYGNAISFTTNFHPTLIRLPVKRIAENEPSGTSIGTFQTIDHDGGPDYSYALVAGSGDQDNSAFTINDNQLITQEIFDYEKQSHYHIRVQSLDGKGGIFAMPMTILVMDQNDEPVLITNTGLTLNEAQTHWIDSQMLGAVDEDEYDDASSIIYTILEKPMHGVLKKNHVTINQNQGFSQEDIDTHGITYTHNGTEESSSDSFVFIINEQNSITYTFDIHIHAQNDPPVISQIDSQRTGYNQTTDKIYFTLADEESDACALSVSVTTSNANLIGSDHIKMGLADNSSCSNQWLMITPTTNQSGAAFISITVSDGSHSSQRSFLLLVDYPDEHYRFERMWPSPLKPWYFNTPQDIASDRQGYIYVADTYNDRIQKFSQSGQLIAKWGKLGQDAGDFNLPGSIDILKIGQLDFVYIADTQNHRIQKFSSSGQYLFSWGCQGSHSKEFKMPAGIATDDYLGLIYVADTGNHRIQVFNRNGIFIDSWGGYGTGDYQFVSPNAIDVDQSNLVYISDYGNNRIKVYASDGYLEKQWHVEKPGGVSVYEHQHQKLIYVSSQDNHCVHVFNGDGETIQIIGTESSHDEQFNMPSGIAISPFGKVYIADSNNHRVQILNLDHQFINLWTSVQKGDAAIVAPNGIIGDMNGNIIVGSGMDDGIFDFSTIQQFSETGEFLTRWTDSQSTETNTPAGIAKDRNGHFYVADSNGHRIQQFDSNGTLIHQFGEHGSQSGQFNTPMGIAISNQPDDQFILVADTENHRIQKFDLNFNYLREWGNPGSLPEQFESPSGVAIDQDGFIYVSDTWNHRIQKFDKQGRFILCWGKEGDQSGEFYTPEGITVDHQGFIYVVDTGNHRIQKFSSYGQYICQFGVFGSAPGQLNEPRHIYVNESGIVFLTDHLNNRIQTFKRVEIPDLSKAIIVSGGGTENNIFQENANLAYRALNYQGFTKHSIFYLSYDIDMDYDDNGLADDVDATPTVDNFERAIQWASGADTLIIYMVGHGGNGMYDMGNNEILTSATLNALIESIESTISKDIIIVYDACNSGSFTQDLAKASAANGKNRILITSSQANEGAYFIGALSFSNYFWDQIFTGTNLSQAFQFASKATQYINVSGSMTQLPILYFNDLGAVDHPEIMDQLMSFYIGCGLQQESSGPEIGNVTPEISNHQAGIPLDLFASNVSDIDGIDQVWSIIWPPNHHNTANTENIKLFLAYNPLTGQYEHSFDGFHTEGTYIIEFFAKDKKGNVSEAHFTRVVVENATTMKALIVIGDTDRYENDPEKEDMWGVLQYLTKKAYRTLRSQGYIQDDIQIFSPVTFDMNYQGAPTILPSASVENINEYLSPDIHSNTKDLVIYLLGDCYHAGIYNVNQSETISAEAFKLSIDNLQNAHPAMHVSIIFDGPRSWSFTKRLTSEPDRGDQRILIASTNVNESSFYLANGKISFSSFFWRQVSLGRNVLRAFENTISSLRFLKRFQNPQLSDDGDDTYNSATDGFLASLHKIGIGHFIAHDIPSIESVSEDKIQQGIIEVNEIRSVQGISEVWAAIIKPDKAFHLSGISVSGNHDMSFIDMIPLTSLGDGKYTAQYDDIGTKLGQYEIAIYAIDDDGKMSEPFNVTTRINNAPDIYEEDDSFSYAGLIHISNENKQIRNFHDENDMDYIRFYGISEQPYTIKLSDMAQESTPVVKLYDASHSEQKLNIYYGDDFIKYDWACGADGFYYIVIQNQNSQIFGENTEYAVQIFYSEALYEGWVSGMVKDIYTNQPLNNVFIQVDNPCISVDGSYFLVNPDGIKIVTANLEGYQSYSSKIVIHQLEGTHHDILMTPVCTYSAFTSSDHFDCSGGSGEITIHATPGCPWSATTDQGWIHLVSSPEGNSDGRLLFEVSECFETSHRNGSIFIKGQAINIFQSCDYYNLHITFNDHTNPVIQIDDVTYDEDVHNRYREGSRVQIEAGKDFMYWNDDIDQTNNAISVNMNADISLLAVFKELVDINISYHSGLNLFSYPVTVPLTLTSFQLLEMLGTDVVHIRSYTDNAWEETHWSDNKQMAMGSNFPIQSGQGLIITTSATLNHVFTGTETQTPIDLLPGMNYVGFSSLPCALSSYDLMNQIGSSEDVIFIKRYHRQYEWTNWFEGNPSGHSFPIEKGEAYIIQMKNEKQQFYPLCNE